jgi:hypothetical protein
MSVAAGQPFRSGSVVSQSVSTLRENIVSFMLIALIVTVLMWVAVFVVVLIFFGGAMVGASSESDPDGMGMMGLASLGVTAVVGVLVIFVVIMAINQLGVAAITYGTIQFLRGRKAGIGECLSRGLSVMGPVLGVAILGFLIIGVAAALGYYILSFIHAVLGWLAAFVVFVAGFILIWVAVPAAVAERRGVVASLLRSVALTEGYRWHILGILLIIIAAIIAIAIALWIIVAVVGWISTGLGGVLDLILNAGFSLAITAFTATVAAVGYYQLRVAKEGVGIEDIARVFD